MSAQHPSGQRMKSVALPILALVILLYRGLSIADEGENLSSLATPICELPELTVAPPSPWYSVPIDSEEPGVEGCQMIWEEGEQYMGIMRLVAFETSRLPDGAPTWEQAVIAFEAVIMGEMGITIGEPLWSRDSVPVSGDGFGNGKAVGLQARLEGLDLENEVHFMLFESDRHKYVLSTLTPSEGTSPDVYKANTSAMGRIMRSLQPR